MSINVNEKVLNGNGYYRTKAGEKTGRNLGLTAGLVATRELAKAHRIIPDIKVNVDANASLLNKIAAQAKTSALKTRGFLKNLVTETPKGTLGGKILSTALVGAYYLALPTVACVALGTLIGKNYDKSENTKALIHNA